MKLKLFVLSLAIVVFTPVFAWEPEQAPANSILIKYDLFEPYGTTEVEVSVDSNGYIETLQIRTGIKWVDVPKKDLTKYRHPSLPDTEIMHYGNYDDESGLGGSFSLCIPYGPLKRVEDGKYWQRAVLAIQVTPNAEYVKDIKFPKDGVYYEEMNGCQAAAQELYGL
ncbi:hypothetical protein QSV34_02005 [Porticoccus sp. W117]|uniref:hypothetical protein n=1 Tax=Porticoccus sp. W117 TaxID=3054777 RepID=UPI002592274B|nr:hypothetical protein [Porticoccus sp. W117]MDM3870122.1 hypothetical protein [Porticoccus sp. W117]